MSSEEFNPLSVDLDSVDPVSVICYLALGKNEYDGRLGARISALFVILVTSSAATFFPVIAARVKWLRINIYVYLFARYFGAGVIIATAFMQYVPTDSKQPYQNHKLIGVLVFSTQPTPLLDLTLVWA